jgi:hypothetical protein
MGVKLNFSPHGKKVLRNELLRVYYDLGGRKQKEDRGNYSMKGFVIFSLQM